MQRCYQTMISGQFETMLAVRIGPPSWPVNQPTLALASGGHPRGEWIAARLPRSITSWIDQPR